MAIYNLKYIHEYKSKYSSYSNDENEDNEEDIDDETSENKVKNNLKPSHLTKEEVKKITNIAITGLNQFPKLKKCCDYINLGIRDNINDDGKYESRFEWYYKHPGNVYLQLMDGDTYSGYPDIKTNGSKEYDKDCSNYVKLINNTIEKQGIKAKFMRKGDDDEAISFGIKSLKTKEENKKNKFIQQI